MPQGVQPGQPFKVVAVNVNGLAAADKRRIFFAWLQQQRYAIVLLSETHSTSDEQGQQWVRQGAGPGRPWQGHAVFAHQIDQGGRAAGGTAVLLSHRIVGAAAEPTVEHVGPSGRVLKVSWVTPWGQRMAAVAVYAPCTQQDRSDFFLGEYMTAVTSGTQECQIVGGDFNCVMRQGDILQTGQQQGRSSRMVGVRRSAPSTFWRGFRMRGCTRTQANRSQHTMRSLAVAVAAWGISYQPGSLGAAWTMSSSRMPWSMAAG